MGVYNKSILTTAGQALLASAVAGGGTVTFPQVQTSSHAYPTGTNIQALTSLQNVVQTAEPTDVAVFNDNLVQVSVRYSNESITTDYLVQTIGVMAQLGTQSPVLFAVVQATTPDQMPAYNGSSPTALIYNIQTTVSGTDNISVTTNPAGTATVADVNNVLENSSQIVAGEVSAAPSSRQWFLSPASSPPAAGSTVLNVELKDAQGNIYYLQTSASQVYTASGQTVEQALANKINTSAISNVQVNSTTNVPSSALAYSMQNAIDVLNAKLLLRSASGQYLCTGQNSGCQIASMELPPGKYLIISYLVGNKSTESSYNNGIAITGVISQETRGDMTNGGGNINAAIVQLNSAATLILTSYDFDTLNGITLRGDLYALSI